MGLKTILSMSHCLFVNNASFWIGTIEDFKVFMIFAFGFSLALHIIKIVLHCVYSHSLELQTLERGITEIWENF